MASAPQPWLEDLSEEWIAQPTPPARTTPRGPDARPDPATQTQSVPPKLRSRIPRIRRSSGAYSEGHARPTARDPRPKSRSALVERSLSENNLSPQPSPDTSRVSHSRSASCSSASDSQASIVYGTVARNTVARSPVKENGPHDTTPEWRRRLVMGEVGYGNQTDLFGPTGLENIFQKPAAYPSDEPAPQSKRKLGLLKGLAAMPSSPPPWPAAARHDHDDSHHQTDPEAASKDNQHQRQDSVQSDPPHDQDDSLSTLAPRADDDEPPRTVSGQIEYENENFSPVFLNTTLDVGNLSTTTPNFRGSELANRLRQIGSPLPSHYQTPQDDSALSQIREDTSFSRIQDDSLPEGLPAGTPDIADVGRYVELRRGGYSREGSFRTRPLSPSPERRSEPDAPAASKNSLRRITSIKTTPADEISNPKTPRRQANHYLSPERAKNPGSPLKLFDAHDTFTSNRLQRRLSQLENKSDSVTSSSAQGNKIESTKPAQKTSRLTSVEEMSFLNSELSSVAHDTHKPPRRVGTFGEGELNKYRFSGDFSVLTSDDSGEDESFPDGSPSGDVAPPGSRQPFRFHVEESPVSREPSKNNRKISIRVSNPFRAISRSKPPSHRAVSTVRDEESLEAEQGYAEGKRGPTSPFKDPTPKRRRTIHSSDSEEEAEDHILDIAGEKTAEGSPVAAQAVIGRKRMDARYNYHDNMADANILARRHILRPRNPTPSQRRRSEIEQEIMEATEAFIMSSPKLNTIREQLEPSVKFDADSERARAAAVANKVAAFSMRRNQGMRQETRKRSVTTQDFLDEAVAIMNFIRAKGRPISDLKSLEETEAESEVLEDEEEHPSSSLTFERPPSREGYHLSGWRQPNPRHLDSNVMDHLRKYEEKETESFLNSSVNSIRFTQMGGLAPREDGSVLVKQADIHKTCYPNQSTRTDDIEDERPTTSGTHQSAGSSLGHTVTTNVSRRSDQVTTLMPQAVAHLIPQKIAGMSFDREKNIWTRQKGPAKEYHRPQEDHSGMNDSEEDPFGNIPDLSVDETEEQEVKSTLPVRPHPSAETILEEDELTEELRPATREDKGAPFNGVSSIPSKTSNFASSFPQTETRATSWSTQAPRDLSTQKQPKPQTTYAIPESDEDDVEHEIKYFEGRNDATSGIQHSRLRDITISIAEREVQGSNQQSTNTPQGCDQSVRPQPKPHLKKSAWSHLKSARAQPVARPSRRTTFHGDGDLSLLEEQAPKNYRMKVSMSVSAPVLNHREQDTLLAIPSSPIKGDVTFMLSDLPDFTLNQVDECELPDRVVVKHDGTRFSKALEDRYAQGTAELVKALQDAKPDEPYWEDLREVSLDDKGLSTLHRLDELCYQLEELDMSNNNISQVEGIPYTVRRLRAQHNALTGLTSWASLGNLQHLDISGNDIDSLDGLAELVHLRVLKVNNNKIESLDSILHLDGLMELSAAENRIQSVDFTRAALKSLTDLDLRKNRLLEIRNLQRLPQLQHLNLDDNQIEEFPLSDQPTERCSSLRSIHLCRNGTTLLDVDRHFPRLESLYVDGNSLTHVSGLEHLRYLRTFSAREQILESDSDAETCVSNLVRNSDVRNLYISLNPTRGFEISQHLLNLQRLELSSMGLKELPADFGQLTPNIRSINLNFNSLKDLRPLLNIKRLNELLVAGNKLERLRANALVLGKLATLSKLDWRDNPLTMRFYAPACENRVISLRQEPSDEQFTERFVLPAGDAEADDQHLSRLDYETRIRRRVTEMMLANLCRNLRELDGLMFDKARVLVKDDVWERLLFLGVLQRKQTEVGNDDTE